MQKRAENLPQDLTIMELGDWLKNNSIEHFTDEVKNYFTPEQIADMEHESSLNGRNKNKLDDLLKTVTKAIKKGLTEEDGAITFEIEVGSGTEVLDKIRRQNDDFIDKGYEVEEVEVYGVVNEEAETVEYFTLEGRLITDRTRKLSAKEKIKHLGLQRIEMSAERDQAVGE